MNCSVLHLVRSRLRIRAAVIPVLAVSTLVGFCAGKSLGLRPVRGEDQSAALSQPSSVNTSATRAEVISTPIPTKAVAQCESVVRRSALAGALARPLPSSVILATVTNAVPDGMSLNDFCIEPNADGATVSFSVLPSHPSQTGQLLGALRKQNMFTNIQLSPSHENGQTIHFSLKLSKSVPFSPMTVLR